MKIVFVDSWRSVECAKFTFITDCRLLPAKCVLLARLCSPTSLATILLQVLHRHPIPDPRRPQIPSTCAHDSLQCSALQYVARANSCAISTPELTEYLTYALPMCLGTVWDRAGTPLAPTIACRSLRARNTGVRVRSPCTCSPLRFSPPPT